MTKTLRIAASALALSLAAFALAPTAQAARPFTGRAAGVGGYARTR